MYICMIAYISINCFHKINYHSIIYILATTITVNDRGVQVIDLKKEIFITNKNVNEYVVHRKSIVRNIFPSKYS